MRRRTRTQNDSVLPTVPISTITGTTVRSNIIARARSPSTPESSLLTIAEVVGCESLSLVVDILRNILPITGNNLSTFTMKPHHFLFSFLFLMHRVATKVGLTKSSINEFNIDDLIKLNRLFDTF